MIGLSRFVCFFVTLAGLAVSQSLPKGVVDVDAANFQWQVCGDPAGLRGLKADPQNPRELIVDLRLTPKARKVLICLKLGRVKQFRGRAPVALLPDYKLSFSVPAGFPGNGSAPNGVTLYYKDPGWEWRDSGWVNIKRPGAHQLTLSGAPVDVSEVGFYISLNDLSSLEFSGQVVVSIDRLWLRPSPPRAGVPRPRRTTGS